MKKKLIIFGVGTLAKMMDFYFSRDSDYEVVAFTVDAEYNTKSKFLGKEVIDYENIIKYYPPQKFEMFIAIGPSKMNTLRERKYKEAKEQGYQLANYISPNAICNSNIGENSVIGDMSVINAYVEFGDNNFATAAVIADFDNDGHGDVAVSWQRPGLSTHQNTVTNSAGAVFYNDGNNDWRNRTVVELPANYFGANGLGNDIEAFDFDGDGFRSRPGRPSGGASRPAFGAGGAHLFQAGGLRGRRAPR